MTQNIKDFLQDLIINLDGRLLKITDDATIYDDCNDALDLINKDAKASAIYKRICEILNYEIASEQSLKEILQTYDIEIKNYKKICEENNK